MIAQLTGTVLSYADGVIVLDVHGVGYKIAVPYSCIATVGNNLIVHTHLAVRENALDLYGFAASEDLWLFELLIQLPKIGPKSALQILNQADFTVIRKAVYEDDPSYLSKVSSISKKTAEKIVSGLKDKADLFGYAPETNRGSAREDDAIDALIALGYTGKDAREALKKTTPGTDANTQIKEALRQLSS